VTHHEIRRVEPDGTRVYSDYHRYTPLPDDQRKNRKRKPDDPRALRFGSTWYLPLEVLPDEHRQMPLTRPDSAILDHPATCGCEVCRRPAAQRLWRRENGLRNRPRRGS
jgi:hypothetical protein